MRTSYTSFARWQSQEHRSWQFEIFRKYNKELTNMLISFKASQKYTYQHLTASGAKFELLADQYFTFEDPRHIGTFKTIRDWSDSHNELSSWIYLNALIALASNFELYLSSIIKLALDSDPGVIFGASHSIDGVYIKKYGKKKIDYDKYVRPCVTGEWDKRRSNFEMIFNCEIPIIRKNIKQLEKLRLLRNDIAHAFGRSLRVTKNHEKVEAYKLPKMTYKKLIKYQIIMFKIVEHLDDYLLKNHIGQYQLILYYHNWKIKNKMTFKFNNTQIQYFGTNFRKDLGQYRKIATKKTFAKDLVSYYENL